LIVDYARSCRNGTWRLFRNRPDVLTRGRFYFVPEDTPHYPGFHHFGSANWTEDKYAPPDEPLLGELYDAPRVYSKGDLGVTPPPPVALGDSECFAGGEVNYPPPAGRTFVMGVDTRCWSDQGLPVPQGLPTLPDLWYPAAAIPPGGPGSDVLKWPNAAYPGTPLVAEAGLAPTLVNPGVFATSRCVMIESGQSFGWKKVPEMLGDFTVIFYARTGPFGPLAGEYGPYLHNEPGTRYPILARYDSCSLRARVSPHTQNYPVERNRVGMWFASRKDSTVLWGLHGVAVVESPWPGGDLPNPYRITVAPTFPGAPSPPTCFLVDAQFYRRALNPAELNQVAAWLQATYPV